MGPPGLDPSPHSSWPRGESHVCGCLSRSVSDTLVILILTLSLYLRSTVLCDCLLRQNLQTMGKRMTHTHTQCFSSCDAEKLAFPENHSFVAISTGKQLSLGMPHTSHYLFPALLESSVTVLSSVGQYNTHPCSLRVLTLPENLSHTNRVPSEEPAATY